MITQESTRRTWIDLLIYTIYLAALAWVFIYANDSRADQAEIKRTIVQVAKQEGIEPELALAIAQVESQFNAEMVGGLGEIGVFQLRPEFHRVSRDSRTNIVTGIRYLRTLKRQCKSYGDAYFVCFNYGQAKRLKYPRLFPYYKKVMLAKQHTDLTLAKRD